MAHRDHVAAARAVYTATADRYVQFVGTEINQSMESAVDRSSLAAFVELVRAGSTGRVADVGCGPGRVAAFLAERGLDVIGVDVSPAMLAAARAAHPAIEFREGRLDRLPLDSGSLRGVVSWYSIIHTPPELLGPAICEAERVLAPDGALLLAFRAGDGEAIDRSDAYGTGLPLVSYHHAVSDVTDQLERAGFMVRSTALREPEFEHESTAQAFVIADRAG